MKQILKLMFTDKGPDQINRGAVDDFDTPFMQVLYTKLTITKESIPVNSQARVEKILVTPSNGNFELFDLTIADHGIIQAASGCGNDVEARNFVSSVLTQLRVDNGVEEERINIDTNLPGRVWNALWNISAYSTLENGDVEGAIDLYYTAGAQVTYLLGMAGVQFINFDVEVI